MGGPRPVGSGVRVDARPLFLFRPPGVSGAHKAKPKMRSELREELGRRFQALLEEEAFDLWDLEIAAQSGRTVLRVYVDRAGDRGAGITLADCSYWNKKLGR